MIDIPSGYTIDGKVYRNLVEEVKWLHDNFIEMIASGNALPAVTAADKGAIVRVDEEGKWSKDTSLTALETFVNAINTQVGGHEISILRLQLQMDNIYGDIQTLGTVLSSIVTGDIGGN